MNLFSKEDVNVGRQTAIDAAKMVTILFMVLVHTFIYVFGEEELVVGFRYVLNVVLAGPFGAPVFMTCMGVGLAYSRRNDPHTMASRGVRLFTVAYILNLLRSLPYALLAWTGQGSEYADDALIELLGIDIFQFAGLTFLAMALFRKWNVKVPIIVLISIVLSIIGSFVRFIDTGSFVLNLFLSLFVGVHAGHIISYFPFCNWFIFVALGYAFGLLLRRCTDVKKFYSIVTPIAAAIFISYMVYAIPRRTGIFSEGIFSNNDQYFFYLTTSGVFFCLMATFTLFGIAHFLMSAFSPTIQKDVASLANELNRIYLIHWIIVIWIVSVLLVEILNLHFTDLTTILMALLILCISAWLARHKPFNKIKL